MLALLLSLSLYVINAQHQHLDQSTTQTRVVALSGLNIRSQPDLKAKVLGGIPFMEEVQILKLCSIGIDTIAEHVYYTSPRHTYSQRGYWVKVKYRNIEGYVFNSYLLDLPKERSHTIAGLNEEFGLNYVGQHCFDNIYRDKKIKWKGVYRRENEIVIEPVEISYYADIEENESNYTWLRIYVENNEGLMFLLGDKNEVIIEGVIEGKIDDRPGSLLTIHSVAHNLFDIENIQIVFEEQSTYPYLYLKQEGRKQLLNPRNMKLGHPSKIYWKGDLDGDDRDDYIINYGDKAAHSILYLSSQAENGDIVKPVAVFFSGYCC